MNTLERVRELIREQRLLSPDETVVVGVSGGPDSLALLHLLRRLATELRIILHVAHLDHKLRGADSEADAAYISTIAREWNLPYSFETRSAQDYSHEFHLSIEEAARVVRYQFLEDVAMRTRSRTIAVGHNADDQVETVLMHLLRGSGLAGLRGMQYRSPLPSFGPQRGRPPAADIELVRPLLDLRKSEIEAYCLEHDLHPRRDRSNLDTTIFRNRLRHEVIPYLERLNPNLRAVLHRTSLAIEGDYDYLQTRVREAFHAVAREADGTWVFALDQWKSLPPALQRGTLREAINRLRQGLRDISWSHIEQARRVAFEKHAGAEATLPQGLMLVRGYDEFTIGETDPLPDIPLLHGGPVLISIGSAVALPDSDWMVESSISPPRLNLNRVAGSSDVPQARVDGIWAADFDADQVLGRLSLRTRRRGERFAPAGLRGRHKSLHEYMIDEKIPAHIRDLLPLLVDEEKIIWVCGHRLDERAIATEKTKRFLRVRFLRTPDMKE